MKKTLLIFNLLIVNAVLANTTYTCTPFPAPPEGGATVQIISSAEARFELLLLGHTRTDIFSVFERSDGGTTIYADSATSGREFSLKINRTVQLSDGGFSSQLAMDGSNRGTWSCR